MTEEELTKNAIEWLKNNSEKPKDNYDYTISLNDAKNAIQWALSHQWINAKDRLPDNDDDVIIHGIGGYVGIYWYLKEDNMFYEAWGDREHTPDEFDFWMSIPEIPKP